MTCAQCDQLREEVRHLRRERDADQARERVALVAHRLNARPAGAWLLLTLFDAFPRPVSVHKLVNNLPYRYRNEDRGDEVIKVHMSHLRKAVGKETVSTLYGYGYALTPQGREKVAEVVG